MPEPTENRVARSTETNKILWAAPQATHIDMTRTLLNGGSGVDGAVQQPLLPP